jgi:hypothetical protein
MATQKRGSVNPAAQAEISKLATETTRDIETHSASLDCLADMLGNMGDMACAANEVPQGQTFYALSHSVRALHTAVDPIIRGLDKIREAARLEPSPPTVGVVPIKPAKRRGRVVQP